MVGYLIATAIWSYRLRRVADWAWGGVANTDAPLAYELAAALACRDHWTSPAYEMGIGTDRESLTLYRVAELTVGTCSVPHKCGERDLHISSSPAQQETSEQD